MAISVNRRNFLRLAGGSATISSFSRVACATDYPTRPVHLLVGFPPGGTADIAARLIGQSLSAHFGQQFVVENRPGASSNLAAEAVARATPDGYVLLAAAATNSVNASLYTNLPFSFTRDFAMVAGVTQTPLVLVAVPSLGMSNVTDFITYAKANPGKLTMASFGSGTISHVTGELFKMKAGIETLHVPYRGSAPMITALLGDQVQAAIDNLPTSIEFIKSGKLRALAVTTKARSPALPDVAALSEFLPGFEASGWTGIAAPKATAASIVETLNTSVNAALADPNVASRIGELGGSAFSISPHELDKFVADEVAKWDGVIKAANIKPE
jgi:tripartite-type tricarboxylate transporter receptor subunit TctC